MPQLDFIECPTCSRIAIGVEPVRTMLNTLLLIAGADKYPGIHPFVTKTETQLDESVRLDNKIVMHGLQYAIYPEKEFESVEDYIGDLRQCDPNSLIDKLFKAYDRVSNYKIGILSNNVSTITKADQKRLLESKESYFEYLIKCFGADHLDISIEEKSYEYLVNPEAMKAFVADHFEYMWDTFLKKEFEKNHPMIENAVSMYNQINLTNLDAFEIARQITGHDIENEWSHREWELEGIRNSSRVVFVPSVHMGPYLGRSLKSDTIYIFFSPRVIENEKGFSSDLTRTDLNVRLSALADDTRLQIIQSISRAGELSSMQIMEMLGLTQSCASRHLKQLSASGFLEERRQQSAKIYRVNARFVTKTLEGLSKCLL